MKLKVNAQQRNWQQRLLVAYWLTLSVVLFACEPETINDNKLHSGTGIWNLISIQTITYDTMGNKISDATVKNPGQFVFLKSESLKALHEYHVGAFLVTSPSAVTYPLIYRNDGMRMSILDCFAPYEFSNVFTILKNGNHRQEWLLIEPHGSGTAPFKIQKKVMIVLEKKEYAT